MGEVSTDVDPRAAVGPENDRPTMDGELGDSNRSHDGEVKKGRSIGAGR